MTPIWANRESRIVSWCRFSARNALNRLCSDRVASSWGSSAFSSRVVPTTTKPSQPTTPTQLTIDAISSGSFTLPPSPRRLSETPWKGDRARLRLRSGRRLTVIIGSRVRWSGSRRAAKREADREHQQGRHFVHRQIVEHAVGHLKLLDRVGQLHRDPEPVGQHLVEVRDAGAAPGGEDPGDAAGRPAGRL